MENKLYIKFKEARKQGRAVRSQWFRRHAKAIYRQEHLDRAIQDSETQRILYKDFRFSNGWFQGFRRQ
jgi:hypothetical protein